MEHMWSGDECELHKIKYVKNSSSTSNNASLYGLTIRAVSVHVWARL